MSMGPYKPRGFRGHMPTDWQCRVSAFPSLGKLPHVQTDLRKRHGWGLLLRSASCSGRKAGSPTRGANRAARSRSLRAPPQQPRCPHSACPCPPHPAQAKSLKEGCERPAPAGGACTQYLGVLQDLDTCILQLFSAVGTDQCIKRPKHLPGRGMGKVCRMFAPLSLRWGSTHLLLPKTAHLELGGTKETFSPSLSLSPATYKPSDKAEIRTQVL